MYSASRRSPDPRVILPQPNTGRCITGHCLVIFSCSSLKRGSTICWSTEEPREYTLRVPLPRRAPASRRSINQSPSSKREGGRHIHVFLGIAVILIHCCRGRPTSSGLSACLTAAWDGPHFFIFVLIFPRTGETKKKSSQHFPILVKTMCNAFVCIRNNLYVVVGHKGCRHGNDGSASCRCTRRRGHVNSTHALVGVSSGTENFLGSSKWLRSSTSHPTTDPGNICKLSSMQNPMGHVGI